MSEQCLTHLAITTGHRQAMRLRIAALANRQYRVKYEREPGVGLFHWTAWVTDMTNGRTVSTRVP